jgi:hypothetical protein
MRRPRREDAWLTRALPATQARQAVWPDALYTLGYDGPHRVVDIVVALCGNMSASGEQDEWK